MDKKCGQNYIIELISWKLFREVLNFEVEAEDKLILLNNIILNTRKFKDDQIINFSMH